LLIPGFELNPNIRSLRKKFPELMKALVMPNDDAETDKTTDTPR